MLKDTMPHDEVNPNRATSPFSGERRTSVPGKEERRTSASLNLAVHADDAKHNAAKKDSTANEDLHQGVDPDRVTSPFPGERRTSVPGKEGRRTPVLPSQTTSSSTNSNNAAEMNKTTVIARHQRLDPNRATSPFSGKRLPDNGLKSQRTSTKDITIEETANQPNAKVSSGNTGNDTMHKESSLAIKNKESETPQALLQEGQASTPST